MPANPETQAPVPKKKKKPPPTPITVNATLGGEGVKQTAKEVARTPKEQARTYAPPSEGVLTTAERKEASTSTQKSSTKQDRKDFHKELRKAKAFRGTLKNPQTKAEKRLAAKGKAVGQILYGKDKTSEIPPTNLQDVPTDLIRVATVSALKDEKKELKKDLGKKMPRASGSDPQVSTGVFAQRQKKLQAGVDRLTYDITRLKQDQAKDSLKQVHKNIKKLQELQGNKKYDQKAIKNEIKAQKKNAKKLADKANELSSRQGVFQKQSVQSNKKFRNATKHSFEFLKQTEGDPANYGEAGFRQRGRYEDAELKLPGATGWLEFDEPKPSSALEDAADMAQWFVPLTPAVRAASLSARAVRGSQLGLKAAQIGKGAIPAGVRGIPTALRSGVAASKGAASTAFKGLLPRGVTTAAANFAMRRAIVEGTPKIIKAVAREGETIAPKVGSPTKTVLERSGRVEGVHAQKHADLIASALDEVILAAAKRTVSTIPSDVNAFKSALLSGSKKVGKGVGIFGGLALAPQIAQGKNVGDSVGLIYRDAYDFMVGVVPATFEMADAGWDAAHGDFDKAMELKDAFLEYDPIGLALQGRWDEALTAYNERPLTSTLELAGVEYAAGRTLGAAARLSPSAKLREFASLNDVRALGPGDTLATDLKRYSPDVFRKGSQKAVDNLMERVSPERARKRRDLENLQRVYERVDRGNGVRQSEILRAVDEVDGEHAELYNRARRLSPDSEAAPNALPFMITRIATNPQNAVADLTAYRAQLVKTFNRRKKYTKSEIYNQNTLTGETIRVIDEILAKPEILQDQKLWDIADEFVTNEKARQEMLWEHSTLTPHQSRAASWIPYIVNHLGGKVVNKEWNVKVQLRDSKGKFVSKTLDLKNPAHLDIIENYAAKNNVAAPGFFRLQGLNDELIPVRRHGFNGKGTAFYSRSDKAIRLGTFDPTFNALYSHARRLRHTVLDSQYVSRIANEWSLFRIDRETGKVLMNKNGEIGPVTENTVLMGKKSEIERKINEAGLQDDYIAVNVDAMKQRNSAIRGMGEEHGSGAGREKYNTSTAGGMGDAINAGIKGETDSTEAWVALPKAVVGPKGRLVQHAKIDEAFYQGKGKYFRRTNRAFKGAVLPFNPHWGLGNVMDMTYRLMVDQSAGPVQWAINFERGRRRLKTLKASNPKAYYELMEAIGHGFMASTKNAILEDRILPPLNKREVSERYEIQRSQMGWMSNPVTQATQMQRSVTIMQGLTEYIKKVQHKYIGPGYRAAQEYNPAGFGLQRVIESAARKSAFGKHDTQLMRDLQNKMVESVYITPEVIRDTTLRLKNTQVQNALAERVNGAMGDYSRMSPEMRRAVYSYSPFALWLRASTTWVLTLPSKHPIQTSFLAAANRLTEPERRELGLSPLNRVERGLVSGMEGTEPTREAYQMGSVDLGGSLFPTQTLTSFGTFNEFGAPLAAKYLMPQISSTMSIALFGNDWTGEELIFPDGRKPNSVERTGIALNSLLETFFPAARWLKSYHAQGAPDETATIYDPKPAGLRDTYISQFGDKEGGIGFEQPERNWLAQAFNPFKLTLVEPEEGKQVVVPYGSAAYSSGKAARVRNLTDKATGSGWLEGEADVQALQESGDIPTPKKRKPVKGWLESEQ